MAHRSRLSTILIDVPAAETDAAVSFWSRALGVETRQPPGEPQFTGLRGALPGLTLAIQAIDGDARYHVDFETDDVEAETARLIALGAEQVDQWLECRILRLPGGQLACVIPRHSDDETFMRLSKLWN
ncbi:VOC family protein [Paractinoplanes brasiliensis]|uniref:Glyoxalase-like domain-containing protein n=1 Tax=Paractinoplanes brasiliensis TaxID=52695 RepID=A0A4R6K2M8_9ACTN|nr:VOC family protein [Actinoplanes brasiliensis]TDO42411.1 hypothetical protein C8E87_6182 [Actinoplanes brasiliensis]GID29645.1 hypothetical protein Abr02nite_46280 [Actinoplanes brasiliensis]